MTFDPKYKVYTWKSRNMLHWQLNPGAIVGDLILGHRVPKVTLIDMLADKPQSERCYIPCPHCDTIHDARTWAVANRTAYKNWFGLYCPSCGDIIPCLTNVFSYLLLAISYPVWGWFKAALKRKWLSKQAERYTNIDLRHVPTGLEGYAWIDLGLGWGVLMFVFMTFLKPTFTGDEITTFSIWIGIPLWTIGGLFFGYSMKKWSVRKPDTEKKSIGDK